MKMIRESKLHRCMRSKLFLIEILLVLNNTNMAIGYSEDGVCLFPERWLGQWFQSGVQQSIVIQNSYLSTKGRCISSKGDKFLLRDEKNCYRCVVIHEKHINVLQYKETYCHRKDSIQNLCQLITGDALLYSMFREDSIPVSCPLKGPFTFTYNRGHGECMSPVSNIDSCTEDSRLILSYQACPDVYGTESAVEELQCLATWNEGNARYLVGKVNHRHAITNEDRYRCFVYEKINGIGNSNSTEYRIAQSGDATCNGLFSAAEGSRTMALKQAAVPARCRFPNWLAGPLHWHSVDQTLIYSFHHRNSSLKVVRNGALETRAHCSQINRQTANDVMIILQYSEGCTHGFICMHFYKRDSSIAELQIGSRATRLEDACAIKHYNAMKLPFITILSSKSDAKNCPLTGHYIARGALPVYSTLRSIRDVATHNLKSQIFEELELNFSNNIRHRRSSMDCISDTHKLHIGCENRNIMEFSFECSTNINPVYLCHGSWFENGTTYIVASQQQDTTNSTYVCLMYTETRDHYNKLFIGNSCERHNPSTHFPAVNVSQIGQCTATNSCTKRINGFAISILMIMLVIR